jgi:predicted nucleotidyltransferase
MPSKEQLFPHLVGEIPNFGLNQPQPAQMWQKHHVIDESAIVDGKPTQYDFSIYQIVQYFQLLMQNNPNLVDSIYTSQRCVRHSTAVAQMVREERDIFLHKGSFVKFKGYAYSELKKIKEKKSSLNETRDAAIQTFGYDLKRAYHVVRLAAECEQILTEGTLDLERNREQLKAIRRGEWTFDRLEKWFEEKERQLEQAKTDSRLPESAREDEIKDLLMRCLEQHYGSLEKAVVKQSDAAKILADMQAVIDRHARGL